MLRTFFLLSCAALATTGRGVERYVAPNGSDTLGTGTIGSPYKTIQKAFNVATPGDLIQVRGGTYRENVTLNGKSGNAGNPITLKSYLGEQAILSGLDVPALTWTSTALRGVAVPVYVAAYTGPAFDQMFFNGKPLLEARWPNVPRDANGDWNFFSPAVWSAVNSTGNTYGTVADSHLAAASGAVGWNRSLNGVRAVLNVYHQFTTWTRLVSNHVAGSETFSYSKDLGISVNSADESGSAISFNDDRYYLVGEKEFLDVPGEWYWDRTSGLLYERGDSVYWIPGRRETQASFPIVPDGEHDVPLDRDVLMWRAAYKAAAHRLMFGSNREAVNSADARSPAVLGEFEGEDNVFRLPKLSGGQKYWWRVDAVMPDGSVIQGALWNFTTAAGK